ncbi:MAG TPA: DUF3102 domain-containing protein [Candidatus Enterococcus avicola]|uniref:DUF3102 domain-containing protein n=1 Tax=Candidatus Enterococcus avicola TaxID=2838561 RepID=A0A9D2F713_9ENTE|nr:DUF3102 domain-containing protein [Candidatus Enterococcus avicola]
MNEVELSNDLNIITAEIKTWKNFAGMSVWEIGKRIKHVKVNDLAHGQYIKWLDSIGMERSEATRYIKIADELPNDDTWQHLSTRAMYLITTLPAEQKEEQIQRVENGEKPTVKEIEDIKRKNREQEQKLKEQSNQLKAKNDQIEMQARMIDDLNEQEPQVVEKTVEVVPSDYEQLKASNNDLQKQLSSVQNDLKMKKMQYDLLEENTASAKALEANIDALRKKEKSIDQRIKATIEFNSLMNEIETFFDKKMASLRFKPLVNELHDTEATNQLSDVVNSVDFWVSEMRKILPNEQTKIIEGEIING